MYYSLQSLSSMYRVGISNEQPRRIMASGFLLHKLDFYGDFLVLTEKFKKMFENVTFQDDVKQH